MHDVSACRHHDSAACPYMSETRPSTTTSSHGTVLVRDTADQEIATTGSRQLRRAADFLAAARFMIGSGAHPQAGRTTLRLAEVFAGRMRRSKDGHFPFSVEATARELGLSRRAVMNHARCLRELGLIAYVEHGSKANALRSRHGTAWTRAHGYRATATLFAAVAPPAWDRAKGRRTDRCGYRARVIGVTGEGRAQAVSDARRAVKKTVSCTPSVVVPQDHQHLNVEGGNNYTPRKRATCKTITPRTDDRPRLSPADCARNITVAEQLRHEIWWMRGCGRRLAHALRPLFSAGWTRESLTAELQTWGVPGHLRDPAAYIRHELQRRRRLGHLDLAPAHQLHDDRVDAAGHRYRAMLHQRAERNRRVWDRSAGLRTDLRRRLAEQQVLAEPLQRRSAYRPLLRESHEDFLRALPLEQLFGRVDPRDIYRARAWGHTPEVSVGSDQQLGWLEQMREQREAEQACAVLAAELDNWEDEHVR